jgi:hypothetical protein
MSAKTGLEPPESAGARDTSPRYGPSPGCKHNRFKARGPFLSHGPGFPSMSSACLEGSATGVDYEARHEL